MFLPLGRQYAAVVSFKRAAAVLQLDHVLHASFAPSPLAHDTARLWSCKQAETISPALAV